MDKQITALVLAAGLSRRMGKDNKLLLPFGKITLLEATLANILAAQLGETCVVVGHEAADIVSVLTAHVQNNPLSIRLQNGRPFAILTNPRYEIGMTTSIQTGVEAAHSDSCGYMICLSDMPFIAPADYQYLKQSFLERWTIDKQVIVQPIFKGVRGNPTIFSSFYRKDILNLTYTEGCKPIVAANKAHLYLVEMPTDAVLRDIDSKEDYNSQLINL